MLFCSSASNAGAACASVSSSGEVEPLALVSVRGFSPWGKWVVTNQNPPTRRRTKTNWRSFIALSNLATFQCQYEFDTKEFPRKQRRVRKPVRCSYYFTDYRFRFKLLSCV